VDNQSFWLDLRILLRTVSKTIVQADVSQPGEEGIAEFQGSGGRTDPEASS